MKLKVCELKKERRQLTLHPLAGGSEWEEEEVGFDFVIKQKKPRKITRLSLKKKGDDLLSQVLSKYHQRWRA